MENIQGFILSIIGVALVLAVGLIVLGQLRTNVGTTCSGLGYDAVMNGTAGVVDKNGTLLCQRYICDNNTFGASGTGAYTVNATRTGCYNASSSVDDINGTMTITQLPANVPAAYNSTGSIQSNLSSIPNWIGIIITVVLAFIVLGYFYNKNL